MPKKLAQLRGNMPYCSTFTKNMLERMRRRDRRKQYIVDLICEDSCGLFRAIALAHHISSSAFPARQRNISTRCLDSFRDTKFERLGVFTYSKEGRATRASKNGIASRRQKAKQRRRGFAPMAEQHKVAAKPLSRVRSWGQTMPRARGKAPAQRNANCRKGEDQFVGARAEFV